MSLKECLRILDLKENADLQDLNVQYRKKIRLYHPDLFAGDPLKLKEAEEKTKQLNLAYARLKKVLPAQKTVIRKRAEVKKPVKQPEVKKNVKEEKDKFDFLASISELITLITKAGPKPDKPESGQTVQSSTKKNLNPQFKDILKTKIATETFDASTRKSYSSVYREMQKKRARYGNRQQDGAGEKGAISPVSPVSPIKTGSIR